MKNEKLSVYVVGGGAAGLAAAIHAARAGASVTVLERETKPGKKLLRTGNGRCNLANMGPVEDAYHGLHPDFASSVLARRIGSCLPSHDGRGPESPYPNQHMRETYRKKRR